MSDSQSESLFGSHNASILQQLLGVLSSAAKQEVKQKTRTSLLSTAFVKKKKHNNTSKRYRITQCKFDSYAFITNTFHTINANFRVVPPLKKKEEEAVFHILCHSSKQQCKQTTHLKPYFWKIRDKKQLGS